MKPNPRPNSSPTSAPVRIFLLISLLSSLCSASSQTNVPPFDRETVNLAQKLLGFEFSDAKLDLLLPGLKEQLTNFVSLRKIQLSNSVPPALLFNPVPIGFEFERTRKPFKMGRRPKPKLPSNPDDLAFYSIADLSELIRTRQITSESLTRFYLERLKRYAPRLECVVTVTEDIALRQARRADAELAAGKYRGPLHGIPYGAKDLLATAETPTTWGVALYTNQVFDSDATVIKKLQAAGAVLIAKTTLGELAMGDIWFGGKTRNPWNTTQGSSGSSAGSCAATAAGLLPFGIGSETLGSIVSPSDRCGTTGLRPTFGRVSRAGAMTLSWSMDKLGPICRSAEDCAIIFKAIYGPDGIDQTVIDAPFNYQPDIQLKKLRLGYLKADFENEQGERKAHSQAALQKLQALGAQLTPVELPNYPVRDLSFVLATEAAAAFDELTRSSADEKLKQQERGSWPNTFRESRFVPAVEYLQAQRVRYLLIQEMARLFQQVDVLLAPCFAGKSLVMGNLTGNPCVVLPVGFSTNGTPTSICFIGKLFDEGRLLGVAKIFQDATDWNCRHPNLDQ